jgi:hypothetical protein
VSEPLDVIPPHDRARYDAERSWNESGSFVHRVAARGMDALEHSVVYTHDACLRLVYKLREREADPELRAIWEKMYDERLAMRDLLLESLLAMQAGAALRDAFAGQPECIPARDAATRERSRLA